MLSKRDAQLVDDLQDLIDGVITIDTFATALGTATASLTKMDTSSAIIDASNDINSGTDPFVYYSINEAPHMIHFDHVHYNAYDDFSAAPTQLNTAKTMNSYSEATLIGEFRIDEASTGAWSFDADMEVYLNNNTRTYSNPLMVDMGNTQPATENIYKGQVIIDAGATNSLKQINTT